MSALTRHCHKCGWEWTLAGQPGRGESCHRCNADLRVCLNCASYDPRVAYQCRDRRADPVEEKAVGNFCELFDFARRAYVPKTAANPREAAARDQLKKLLGD
jgi:ribosome-binding protein aMBF1 (putative translation factor)